MTPDTLTGEEIQVVDAVVEAPIAEAVQATEAPVRNYEAELAAKDNESAAAREKAQQLDALYEAWEQKQIEELTGKFFEVGVPNVETGEVRKLAPQEEAQLKNLVNLGAQYQRVAPRIAEQNMMADALTNAWKVVGDGGTVAELRKVMTELVDLGDVRLMEKHANWMKETARGTVRDARASIDRAPASPAASTVVSDVDQIAEIISQPGGIARLNDNQKRTYAQWRKSKGLPVPSGW